MARCNCFVCRRISEPPAENLQARSNSLTTNLIVNANKELIAKLRLL